jgi:TonB-dependent receptor
VKKNAQNGSLLHHALLGSASVLAIGVLMGPALAQATSDQVETVVVTGIRASLQSAQAIKQNSDQVVDSISAVDIGALPDRSVAEALQRVPGVQITRTDQNRDPVRWAGYGNGVFIRGLSWVQALTNGHSTFGAENGRTISFADISASLMAGVDVYKNPDATMIEGGVGGTVDLRTRKPFDQDGRLMAIALSDDYGDLNQRFAPAINGLFSDRWNTKLGEIGVLVSADYQDLRASNNVFSLGVYNSFCLPSASDPHDVPPPQAFLGTCTANGVASGQNVEAPYSNAVSYRHMDWDQKRVALYGAFQWRPNDKLEFGLTTIYSKADPTSIEHVVTWGLPTQYWAGGPVDAYSLTGTPPNPANTTWSQGIGPDSTYGSGYVYDSQGSWKAGEIHNANNVWGGQDTRYGVRHHTNIDISANMKYNPTEALAISADVQYTEARATMYDMTLYTKQVNNQDCWYPQGGWWQGNCPTTTNAANYYWPNAPVIDVAANFAGNVPTMSYRGDVGGMQDASQYVWGAAMDHVENNYAHNWAARADATYSFEGSGAFGFIKSFAVGFRSDLREAATRQSNWNWKQLGYQTWWQGWSWAPDISQYRNSMPMINVVGASSTQLYKFDTFFGQSMPSMWFPTVSLTKSGGQAIWSAVGHPVANLLATGGMTGGWVPLSVQYGCTSGPDYYCNAIYANTTPGSTSQTAGINTPTEDTYAGYFQVNYAHDNFFGLDLPFDGNAGFRIVTTQDTSGPGYFLLPAVTACTNPPSPCTGTTDRELASAWVGAGGGSLALPQASVDHSYTDVLPSFNFRAHITDELQGRLAFSQQIVRPDFAFTQNYTTLGFTFAGNSFSQCSIYGVSGLQQCLTGQGGNPNLQPLHANNYDASLEWYFSATGNLSLGLFYKDINNYFETVTLPETYTRNSQAYTFYVTRYENGGNGIVKGFELAYQQFYDFLPGAWGGLGLQANYTKIWNNGGANPSWNITSPGGNSLASDTTLPLEGMSNDSYNIALMYEKYGISGRVAYNWRSGFLMTTSAANLNQPVWQEKFGQLDGSLLYTFLEHYKIGVQATNLLHAKTFLDVGSAAYHPRYEWVDSDRKLSVILRANW